MYRGLFLIAAAATALSSSVWAADLRGSYMETPLGFGALPLPVAPRDGGFDWSGPYVGLNVGYGGGTEHYDYTIGTRGADLQHDNGVLGGAQIGYNQALTTSLVAGLEADFDGASIGGSALLAQSGLYARVRSHTDYVGTVRGRFGYAFDRVMVYATAGLAYAGTTTSVDAPNTAIDDSVSRTHLGYAVGGGVGYAMADNVMLRGEYLHLGFGSKIGSGPASAQIVLQDKPTEDVVRAGVDYRFDMPAPLAAPFPVSARY